ncbi:MAG: N-acetylmuramic acid 6-phosphate etherase [Alphaproteobacteria bacterium]|nr:N-acetylmuramic acid 6-phosphate etherase [Alphaproteobacteria bacterium]
MSTESVGARYRGLDAWPSRDILDVFIEGQMTAIAAVRAAAAQIEAAAEAVTVRMRAGGRLVYVGAGTSGRLALLDGVELMPTFDWPDDRVVYLIAGGEKALTRAVEGAEDDRDAGKRDILNARVDAKDAVIAVAASGTTPYTIAALEAGRAAGALGIGIANNAAAALLTAAELPILLDTGPEAIGGSTRMKAGTAQKATLNLLSSLVMTRLGRVHDGYMVDLRATNLKLRKRSERMLMDIADVGAETARDALRRCNGKVKPAVLVAKGLTPDAAERALAQAGGSLRQALKAIA